MADFWDKFDDTITINGVKRNVSVVWTDRNGTARIDSVEDTELFKDYKSQLSAEQLKELQAFAQSMLVEDEDWD